MSKPACDVCLVALGALLASLLGGMSVVGITSAQARYLQAPAAMHVQTTVSTGEHTPEEVVRLARDAGIKVVVFGDHEVVSLVYGAPPFRNLFRRKESRGGVFQFGTERYLRVIRDLAARNPDMALLPGVESVPFYYWTGNPFDGLTANNWHKHLILLGFTSAEQIDGLPVLHGKFSLRYASRLLPPNLVFFSLLSSESRSR